MSGSQTSTTTQNSQPWSGQQQPLLYGFNQAKNIYNSSSPQYYPGSTVAAQSPLTQAYNQGSAALGVNGDPTTNAAGSYLQNVLGGQYLNSGNPNDSALWDSIQSKVLPAVNSQFSLAGRYGSGAQANELAQGLTNAYAPYAFQNFQQERGNQQAAAGMAPSIAGANLAGLQQLGAAGQGQDQYAQNLVNAGVNQWNYNQNLPYNKLLQYMGIIGGNNWGTSGTSTQTQPSGGIGGFLGGLLGGIL